MKNHQKVRVHQVFGRFSIALPTSRRDKTVEVRTIENAFGKITIHMQRPLIARDMKVFIALATYMHENPQKVSEIMIGDELLYGVEIDVYHFVSEYMHKAPSKLVYDTVVESFTILSQTRVEGEYIVDGEHRTVGTYILPYVKHSVRKDSKGKKEKNTIHLLVFPWAVHMLTKPYPYTLLIENSIVQQTSSSVATLLCIFLMTQATATSYSKKFLIEQLGLHALVENDHVDRELKRAFSELQSIGYIKSWYIEKRKDDTYYIFSRTASLSKPKTK